MAYVAVLLALAASTASARPDHDDSTLAVVMTNDPAANQILVFDTGTNEPTGMTVLTERSFSALLYCASGSYF